MTFRFITALVLSIVASLITPAWADFQTGLVAYNLGDYARALREWTPLAEQENPLAQFYLGALYQDGLGVPQDYVQAHMWYNLAGTNGNQDAVEFRDRLAGKMTPAQIAEAQKLAREWKSKSK